MKKKLFALLIAGVMAMSVNAFAAETELTEEMTTESAADTSTVVLQGLDDNGTVSYTHLDVYKRQVRALRGSDCI